jgi:hypothetical protein
VNIMRIKPPVLPQPAPGLQLYDYIVEIYADKIVIRHAGGEITLQSVDKLNEWLSSVRDKKIAVFSYIPLVEDYIFLTRNFYYFAYGRFKYVFLKEGGIVLMSDAFLYEVLNANESWEPTDISHSYISVNAEFVGLDSAGTNITIIGYIGYISLYMTSLDTIIARGVYFFAEECTIGYLIADYFSLIIYSSQINNYYLITTHYYYELHNVTINASGEAYITVVRAIDLLAHETKTYKVHSHGVEVFYPRYVHITTYPPDATPVSYTYSYDSTTKELNITITNPNDGTVTAKILVIAEAINPGR